MNNEELKKYCREHAGEDMSLEADALLKSDANLQREVDQQIAIQRLMALKRNELPQTGSAERCLRAVQGRIETKERLSVIETIRSWFTYDTPSPALVYAAATMVVLVLGAFVFMRGDIAGEPMLADTPEAVIQPVAMTPEVETNQSVVVVSEPVLQKPIIMLRVEADQIPESPRGGLTFGGDTSVPVSYER